jgi:hypothetical protein
MSFRDFFRNVASKVGNVAKQAFHGAGKVLNTIKGGAKHAFHVGSRIADTVKNVYDKVTHIPVIGNVVKQGAEKLMAVQIPKTPLNIGQVLRGADKIAHEGNRLLN